MFESCMEIRSQFSDYLDDRCGHEERRSIRFHLSHCAACREELEQMQAIQRELRALPQRPVSPELALQVRVRLSQRAHRNFLSELRVRFDNAFRPFLLPASGGVLTAVIFFGLIMGTSFVPATTLPDVPLSIVTPPRVRNLAPIDFSTGDEGQVLLIQVDAAGRVMSYKVLSGQVTPQLTHNLDMLIYFSVFDPATTFGKPTDGQVVLSLRRITVRG